MYPDGIYLSDSIYQSLENSIQRDCRVLETFKIMDYSLLIGIHNVDHASREDMASNNLTSNITGGGISDGEYLKKQDQMKFDPRLQAELNSIQFDPICYHLIQYDLV